MEHKYPLYMVSKSKTNGHYVVCFKGYSKGTVVETYTTNTARKVGYYSPNWVHHEDKETWAPYADINQYIDGKKPIKDINAI